MVCHPQTKTPVYEGHTRPAMNTGTARMFIRVRPPDSAYGSSSVPANRRARKSTSADTRGANAPCL